MAGQGCPNEGSDTRLFGRWGCRIQSALSFKSRFRPRCHTFGRFGEGRSLTLCWPPFVAYNSPDPARPPERRWLSVRFLMRYDTNWPGYIWPEFIIKRKDKPLIY